MDTQTKINTVAVLTNLQIPLIRCRIEKIKSEDGTFRRTPSEKWKEKIITDRPPESFHDCNVAIKTGHKLPDGRYLYIIDVDLKKQAGRDEYARLKELHGTSWTMGVSTQTESGGLHYWFAHKKAYSVHIGLFDCIDFLGLGSISYEPPTQFQEDGIPVNAYKWITNPPESPSDIPELPNWVITELELREIKNNMIKERREKADAECAGGVSESGLKFIEACFERYTPDEGLTYQNWLKIAMAFHEGSKGSDEALAIFDRWGARVADETGGQYSSKKTRITWDSFGSKELKITYASLVKMFSQDPKVSEFINNGILECNKLFTSVTRQDGNSEVTSESSNEVTKKDGTTEYLYQEALTNAVMLALGNPLIRTNETSGATEITFQGQEKPKTLDTPTETHIIFTCRDFARSRKIKPLAKGEDVMRVVGMVADRNKYHPVREYLDKCLERYRRVKALGITKEYVVSKMSGKSFDPERIYREQFFQGVGLKQTTSDQKKDFEWFKTSMDFFLRGMICKVFWQFQNPVLVLQGDQGIGKSTLAKSLVKHIGGDYFYEGNIDPDNKDHRIKMAQLLLWEPAEISATISNADINKLKALITISKISERPPYGRYNVTMDVVASFMGTVNDRQFLKDHTGNRRFRVCPFYPVDPLSTINYLRGPAFDPDLLFGEVYDQLLRTGEKVPLMAGEELTEAAERAERVRSRSDLESFLEDMVEIQPITEHVKVEWRLYRRELQEMLMNSSVRNERGVIGRSEDILSKFIGFSYSDTITGNSPEGRYFRRCRRRNNPILPPSMVVEKKATSPVDEAEFT